MLSYLGTYVFFSFSRGYFRRKILVEIPNKREKHYFFLYLFNFFLELFINCNFSKKNYFMKILKDNVKYTYKYMFVFMYVCAHVYICVCSNLHFYLSCGNLLYEDFKG